MQIFFKKSWFVFDSVCCRKNFMSQKLFIVYIFYIYNNMHTEENFKYFKIQLSKKAYFEYILYWLGQVKLCSGNKWALNLNGFAHQSLFLTICSGLWQREGFHSRHRSGSYEDTAEKGHVPILLHFSLEVTQITFTHCPLVRTCHMICLTTQGLELMHLRRAEGMCSEHHHPFQRITLLNPRPTTVVNALP